jgi:N-acetylmuramic acid 6-phosphate etherase
VKDNRECRSGMEPPAGTNDLTTEKRNKNSLELDTMTTQEILTLINAEDQKVAPAVAAAIPQITQAVDLIAGRLKAGGRLFYVGAGTSGRLGILDVAEVRPTFGIGLDTVEAIIAGGARAITEAVEEAEDDFDQGGRELRLRNISEVDAVVGIAASGSTPFVLGALLTAREAGAAAIGIACNHNSRLRDYADIAIEVVVGPEILTGSTRMKAGTAQKMVLNMISTAVMVNLGQVYENLMVGMQITNTKLVQRAIRMVAAAAEVTVDDAAALLEASQRDIKLAIVMGKLQADAATARQLLENAQGYVRKAVTLGLEKKD